MFIAVSSKNKNENKNELNGYSDFEESLFYNKSILSNNDNKNDYNDKSKNHQLKAKKLCIDILSSTWDVSIGNTSYWKNLKHPATKKKFACENGNCYLINRMNKKKNKRNLTPNLSCRANHISNTIPKVTIPTVIHFPRLLLRFVVTQKWNKLTW